jgi:hypothetical protein
MVRERLIHVYYRLGEEQKAEEAMEALKKQSKPGDPGRQTLGLIYLRHGKLEESIAELDSDRHGLARGRQVKILPCHRP